MKDRVTLFSIFQKNKRLFEQNSKQKICCDIRDLYHTTNIYFKHALYAYNPYEGMFLLIKLMRDRR